MTQSTIPIIEQRYAIQALEYAIERGEPEIICWGAKGVGKTLGLSDSFLTYGLRYPSMTQFWLRKERSRMSDTILKTFEEEVLSFYPFDFGTMNRDNRGKYALPGRSEILLEGMDDEERLKGLNGDLIWINEPTDVSERHWEITGGSARHRIGSTFPHQVKVGDVNPTQPSHWSNARCPPIPPELIPRVPDDGTRMAEWLTPDMYLGLQEYNLASLDTTRYKTKRIVFCMADNPAYWSIDPWGLKPFGLEYIKTKLARMSHHQRARFLEGRPIADEGAVFPEFDEDKHVIEPFPNGWPSDWPVWIGYDPGYAHPCAVVFLGVAPNGQFHIIDEIHGSEIDLDTLGPRIKQKAAKHRVVRWLDDPRGANQRRQDTNGKTVRDLMRERHRLFFQPWQAAEGAGKQAQVEAIRLLLLARLPLQIWSECKGVIGEFQSWMYKVMADGSIGKGDDAYEDRDNDAMDALCGIVANNPAHSPPSGTMSQSGSRR